MKNTHVTMKTITEGQCAAIMDAVCHVLENTGCEVRSEKARTLLSDAGCAVKGSTVEIPARLVKNAISTAPKTVRLYNRDGEEALELTPESCLFGPGISCVETIDVFTGEPSLNGSENCTVGYLPGIVFADESMSCEITKSGPKHPLEASVITALDQIISRAEADHQK